MTTTDFFRWTLLSLMNTLLSTHESILTSTGTGFEQTPTLLSDPTIGPFEDSMCASAFSTFDPSTCIRTSHADMGSAAMELFTFGQRNAGHHEIKYRFYEVSKDKGGGGNNRAHRQDPSNISLY